MKYDFSGVQSVFLHSDSRGNGYGEKRRQLSKDFQSRFLTLSTRFFSSGRKTELYTHQVALVAKNGPSNAGDVRHSRRRFNPWVRKKPWRRKWQLLQYPCLENPHEQKSLECYRPEDHKESDTTEATQHTQKHTYTYILEHYSVYWNIQDERGFYILTG